MPSMSRIDLCGAVLVFTLKLLDMKKHYILTGLVLLAASQGFAQVKIGAAGAPDPSASLEVTSGAAHNKGLLLPRLTDGERNAMTNPASGLLIFNTSANSVQVNIGTSLLPLWVTASATATAWNITGNTNINPATNFLGTTDDQPLVVRTNNTEKVRVTGTGSVGIGTNNPAVKLQIMDTVDPTMLIGTPNGNGGRITLGNGNHGLVRNLSSSGGHANDIALYTSSGNSVGSSLYLVANPVSNSADSLPIDQFVLKNTGNVGIGTSAPAARLHVNNGNIRITNNGPISSSAISIISDNGGSLNPDNVSITTYGPANPLFGFSTARGTAAAPLNSQAGDNSGQIAFGPRINGAFSAISGIASAYLGNGTTGKSKLAFYTSGVNAMIIDSSGNVSIGTNPTPKTKLDVGGGILLSNDENIAHGNGTFLAWSSVRKGSGETEFVNYKGLGGGGFRFYDLAPGTAEFNVNNIAFIAPGTGAYTNVSDMRVKTNVNIINDGLQKVMAMRPVSYDFHSGRTIKDGVVKFTENDQVVKTIGFLAQELAKVVPEAVIIPKDPSNELYNVSYATVIPVLTKAIQEQQAEIEQLKAALAVSKADNAALKADVSKISALAERMQQLEASLGTKAAGNTTVSK